MSAFEVQQTDNPKIVCEDCPEPIFSDSKAAARKIARDQNWSMWKTTIKTIDGGEEKSKRVENWLCPSCRSIRIQGNASEAAKNESAKVADIQERLERRAKGKAREIHERREAKRENDERRKTRKVGSKIARADSTLTAETERLVAQNEFERHVFPRLNARQKTVADEWRRQWEASQGVSDREAIRDRVDRKGHTDFGNPLFVAKAVEWRSQVEIHLGQELTRVLKFAIEHDKPAHEIGGMFTRTISKDSRGRIGMAFIRVALDSAGDCMGLKR